jgi:flagellar biogenesis protein FliO
MEAQPSVWTGFGSSLAMSFASFGLVCLAAWAFLRWLAFRARGGAAPGRGLRLRAKLSLEPRRAIYVIEAGSRAFLIGGGETGLNLLAELDPADVPAEGAIASGGARAGDWWGRLLAPRGRAFASPPAAPSPDGLSVGGVTETPGPFPRTENAPPAPGEPPTVRAGDEASS